MTIYKEIDKTCFIIFQTKSFFYSTQYNIITVETEATVEATSDIVISNKEEE